MTAKSNPQIIVVIHTFANLQELSYQKNIRTWVYEVYLHWLASIMHFNSKLRNPNCCTCNRKGLCFHCFCVRMGNGVSVVWANVPITKSVHVNNLFLQLSPSLQLLSHVYIFLFRLLAPCLHPPLATAHLVFRVLEVLSFWTMRFLHYHFLRKLASLLMLLCQFWGPLLSLILTRFSSPNSSLFSTFPKGHKMPGLLSYQTCTQTSAKIHPVIWSGVSPSCFPGVSLVVQLKVVAQTEGTVLLLVLSHIHQWRAGEIGVFCDEMFVDGEL